MSETTRPYTFDRVVRIVIGLSVFVGIFLLVQKLSHVLLPFVIGWLLAYLLNPVVNFFQFKLKFRYRILAITTTLTLFSGIITGIIFALIPLISKEVSQISELIVSFSQNFSFSNLVPAAWEKNFNLWLATVNWEELLNNPNMQDLIQKVAPRLWDFLSSSFSFVLGLMVVVVILLYLIFILLDFEKITTGWRDIIPAKYKQIVFEITDDLEEGMNKYFRGQALVALISGSMLCIGFYFIGLPLAIVFGIFVGVLTLVPYLKTVALVPAFFLVLLQSHQTGQTILSAALGVVIVFTAVQIIEDLVLVPKIMGKVTGLKPAVILLSLSIWGSLMGIVGMIIALPMTTLIISYYKRWVLRENIDNKEGLYEQQRHEQRADSDTSAKTN